MKRVTLNLQAPYVGLRPFGERDAILFFGREQHVQDLLDKLEGQQRFIAILGASGTGKSSLVRAGLVPALHRGALTSAGHSWNICSFKPGDAPLTNLAHALIEHPGWSDSEDRGDAVASLSASLARSPLALSELYRQKVATFSSRALLLVVDQFEEIFRYRQKNIDEAEAFMNLLLRSAFEDVPIYVVLTMRSDFLGNCARFFGLPEAINQGIYLTPRLGPDQLKSIIVSPLALVGGEIDPVLVTKLVNTLEGEDELPILEHALLRMWNRAHSSRRMRIEVEDFEVVCASYDKQEGHAKLAYAIDNHASEIYDTLSEHQQRIARRLFLALVERRDGRDVRRPRTVDQLFQEVGESEPEDVSALIEAFRTEQVGFLLPPMSASLSGDTMIDISHESLFRQWRRFWEWLIVEELDVAELKEWQQRATRQKAGGGWLDEYDCESAGRWRLRLNRRGNPTQWATRYGGPGYAEVNEYIDRSIERLQQTKGVETKRLEWEATVQWEVAARAEKEKQRAQEFAKESQRKTRIALVGGVVAMAFFLIAAWVAWYANQEKTRAEREARYLLASELAVKAEIFLKEYPDQGSLLALAAWHMSPIAPTQVLVRAAVDYYSNQTVLRGHEGAVWSAQFTPDGKQVVTASEDRTVRLWDVASGKELHVLHGHENGVVSVQFAPDGKQVVTASEDRTARLWDLASGKELHIMRHGESVSSAQFAPDGKTVMTASADKMVRLWDVASGKERHVLRGHKSGVFSLQVSRDGKTVATASEDRTARLWDVASGKELHVLRGHENGVVSVQFAPDGKQVVTASEDRTVRLWDLASGKELHIMRHGGSISSAQFAPDGKTVVTASADKTARLWDVSSGKELRVLWHEGPVSNAQFAPDGKQVVTTGEDRTVRLWDVISGKAWHVLRGHEGGVVSAQFTLDGKRLITVSKDKTARLWDMAGRKAVHVLHGHESGVSIAQFSPDGKRVVTASRDGTARLWDVASGKELHMLRGHESWVSSAQFALDGKTVVTASGDGTARLWDVASGKELHVMPHKGSVSSAQFAPDGKTVVTAGEDRTARVWDVASGKELHVMPHKGSVSSAQFAPDGKWVVTGSWDKTAWLWDVASGKELHVFHGHESWVSSAQFAPDGKTVVTASGDGAARVWDVVSGKELHVLRGHESWVSSAQFAPDGKTVVTASGDGTARVWEVANGKELHMLRGHESWVSSAQVAPDGKTVVTASGDGTARLWDMASGKQLHVFRGHESGVSSAQFALDGRTVVTASDEKTARLWRCEVCRPVDELAAELRKTIGRDLTDEERRRYGVPDESLVTAQ